MPIRQSNRCDLVKQSDIRSMTLACAERGGINLAQGVCDLDVPEPVLQGAADAMREGYNVYTRFDGLPELRLAIAEKQRRFQGLNLDPETQIVVSAGATGAFQAACTALLEAGDEVLLFEPYYGYHVSTLRAMDVTPRFVPLHAPDWSFDDAELEAAASPRLRAVVLNTPCNPCGKVFSRAELERVADFCQAHDLFLFTDEIYEHFVYDGLEHVSPACLPGMEERTIAISGASKVFAVTGWRLGWASCHPRWREPIGHFNDLYYVCAPAPLQIGVARGITGLGQEYYHELAEDHGKKRDRFCEALKNAGLAPHVPQGAYYALADISSLPGRDSRERAMHLLERTGVACVPGRAFWHDGAGEGLARFCFAKRWPELNQACERLERLS
ncbi:pyridoxal phosphate-dependent aminotransferase [Paucidesulfovibrio longus]|uniref:pyridoxal phosphate-dependent aminotransferase n=1 Tax=Paucidesulfovibrio longus TaxID=889 RepID=UPI0003B3B50D|nr:aminotransferase class I/II-fold pyridoxal phosphate-dependent enzyme [Paucidesulfovibrio longus]